MCTSFFVILRLENWFRGKRKANLHSKLVDRDPSCLRSFSGKKHLIKRSQRRPRPNPISKTGLPYLAIGPFSSFVSRELGSFSFFVFVLFLSPVVHCQQIISYCRRRHTMLSSALLFVFFIVKNSFVFLAVGFVDILLRDFSPHETYFSKKKVANTNGILLF